MILEIKNLRVRVGDGEILRGTTLALPRGQVHFLMGPNGAGKSTLLKAIMGHPGLIVDGGDIFYRGESIAELAPEERAHRGLFLSAQEPPEMAGVTNERFLGQMMDVHRRARAELPLMRKEFEERLRGTMNRLEIADTWRERMLNSGFSGGEKKKNEMLHMTLLCPELALLDEIDSGLDLGALRHLAQTICDAKAEGRSLLIITHSPRLADLVEPDRVHILMRGAIVRSGGKELVALLEKQGYEWLS